MEGYARRVCLALLVVLGAAAAGTARFQASEARSGQARTCTYDHQSLRTEQGSCRPRARAYPPTVTSRVERAIYDGALTFGIPYTILLAIAQCESGLRPHASYHGHYGLYQFLPATFRTGAAALKRDTGIQARSYWKPLDSSYVAGYLFATGDAKRWTCETAPVG